MKYNLKEFQLDTLEKSWEFISARGEFNFQAPTGTGKTLVTAAIINQFIEKTNGHNYSMLHFSPSTGNLYEQNYSNFEKYKRDAGFLNYNTSLFLSSLPNQIFQKNKIYFFGWDKIIKSNSKIVLEQERANFWDVYKKTLLKGIKFLIVVDEQHIGSSQTSDATQKFLQELNNIHRNVFGELPVYIRTSATFNINYGDDLHHSSTYEQAKEAELVKKDIIVNDFSCSTTNPINEIEQLVHAAIDKREQISLAYSNKSKETRNGKEPLIIIQLENGNKNVTRKVIEKAILSHGGFSIKHAAIWLDDVKAMFDGTKITKKDIEINDDIKLLIFKQAIATGWDVPRASVWVKFRKNMNQSFEVQTLGRILRNQFLKYFNNDLIDCGFVYTDHKDAKPKILNTFNSAESIRKIVIKKKETISENYIKTDKIPFKIFSNSKSQEDWKRDFLQLIEKESIYKSKIVKELLSNKKSLSEWVWESPETSIIKAEDIDEKPSFISVQQSLEVSNKYTLLNKYYKFKNQIMKITMNNLIIFDYLDNFLREEAVKNKNGDIINLGYKFFFENVGVARSFVIELIELFNKVSEQNKYSKESYLPHESVEFNESYIDEDLVDYSDDNYLFYDTEYLIDEQKDVFQSNQERSFYKEIKNRKKNYLKLDSFIEYIFYNLSDPKQYYFSEYVGKDFKVRKYFPDFIIVTEKSIYVLDTKTLASNKITGSPGSLYKMKKYKSFLEGEAFKNKEVKFGYVFFEDGVWKVAYNIDENLDFETSLLSAF